MVATCLTAAAVASSFLSGIVVDDVDGADLVGDSGGDLSWAFAAGINRTPVTARVMAQNRMGDRMVVPFSVALVGFEVDQNVRRLGFMGLQARGTVFVGPVGQVHHDGQALVARFLGLDGLDDVE